MGKITPQVVFCLFFSLSVPAPGDEPVVFSDARLEGAVREKLQIPVPTPITQTDINGLTVLTAYFVGDLAGLEHAGNLQSLHIGLGSFHDLSPLAGLAGIQSLLLDYNSISDISTLPALPSLHSLDLRDNLIVRIPPLAKQTELANLKLQRNQISDISGLSGLSSMDMLDLSNNQVADISALASFESIFFLRLGNNLIEDISPLVNLGDIGHLDLRGNPLNVEAYHIYLPMLQSRFPKAQIDYDPVPEPGTSLVLLAEMVLIRRGFRRRYIRQASSE